MWITSPIKQGGKRLRQRFFIAGELGSFQRWSVPAQQPIPGVLVITATDNADSTATYSVTGSNGQTIELYWATVENYLVGTWTYGGSRIGDGTFSNVAVGSGFRVSYAQIPGAQTIGGPILHRVTSGATAIFESYLQWIYAKLQTLSLTSIPTTQIYRRRRPWVENITLPAVIVSPVNESVLFTNGDNQRDDVGYGAVVTLIEARNQVLDGSDENRTLKWREDIRRALQNSTPTGLPEVHALRIEPGIVRIPEAFARQYDVQSWIVRGISRESRI